MSHQALARARLGRILADTWRVEGVLGVGGMAAVYRGLHLRNGLGVAIKVLHPEFAANEEFRRRFLREGYVANRIEHPAVVKVLDDGVDGEDVFLIMELLTGQSLKEAWSTAQRRLPLERVVPIANALLEVLAKAHEAGVIHRDIKPDNVFLCDDGAVRVLDFGVARLREQGESEQVTVTGAMMGTPAFMAPEQALARWNEVDGRSDLFSVGATMWTLLTGRLVHAASTVPELLVAAATRAAPGILTVIPDLAPPIAEVIDRSLSFDKQARFESAGAMREALNRAWRARRASKTVKMEHPELLAPPSAPLEQPTPTVALDSTPAPESWGLLPTQHGLTASARARSKPPPSRTSWWRVTLVAASVAMGGAGTWFLWSGRSAESADPPPASPIRPAALGAATDTETEVAEPSEARTEEPTISPVDGQAEPAATTTPTPAGPVTSPPHGLATGKSAAPPAGPPKPAPPAKTSPSGKAECTPDFERGLVCL